MPAIESEEAIVIGDEHRLSDAMLSTSVTVEMPSRSSPQLQGHYIWQDLTYHVPLKGSSNTKKILKGITGCCSPGQTLALLGPSGAGKTTLLDLLACRSKAGVYTGELLLDGKEPTRPYLRSIGGYVLQDDVFYGFLTVKETLSYSARLRLPGITVEQRRHRVDEVLSMLGLSQVCETRIGTQFLRGISGGEKKRLSIGVELVTKPSILFLDEVCLHARSRPPTTSLSPSFSLGCFLVLHRFVPLSTHFFRQPSMALDVLHNFCGVSDLEGVHMHDTKTKSKIIPIRFPV